MKKNILEANERGQNNVVRSLWTLEMVLLFVSSPFSKDLSHRTGYICPLEVGSEEREPNFQRDLSLVSEIVGTVPGVWVLVLTKKQHCENKLLSCGQKLRAETCACILRGCC
ncbi:unnamed protein product [Caretta caretta]